MQSSTPALAAAIESKGRRPVQRVLVDWDRDGDYADPLEDLTAGVTRVSVDQTLHSDLPGPARLLSGYSSAEATVEIGQGNPSDPSQHAAWWFSPYNVDSPLAPHVHLNAPVSVQFGMDLGPEPELVSAFTGLLRDLTVRAGARSAVLTALDDAEKLRRLVSLPAFPADDLLPASTSPSGNGIRKPGLSGEWVIDYVLRQCEIYASPAVREHAILSVTMHGSVQPEVGLLNRAIGNGGVWQMRAEDFIPVAAASMWMQPESSPEPLYQLAAPLSTNDDADVFFEMWTIPGATEKLLDLRTEFNAASDPKVTVQMVTDEMTGVSTLSLVIRRSATITVYVPGPVIDASARSYLGVHIHHASTGVTVRWRLNDTTTTEVLSSPSVTGQPSLVRCGIGSAGLFYDPRPVFEAVQVANEPYATGIWNDDFVPSAFLDPSLNQLIGIPAVENSAAWQIVQDVAAAEFGLALFDENGIFRFRNRQWRRQGHSLTSQRTLTATSSLKDIGSVESVDAVRNRILIRAQPVSVTPPGQIWAVNEVLAVPAGGEVTVWADLRGAVFQLDTTPTFSPVGGQQGSGYRAASLPDGSGRVVSNLKWDVELAGSRARVRVRNGNSYAAYLVNPVGYPNAGSPALSLWGQVMTTEAPGEQRHAGPTEPIWTPGVALHVPPNQYLTVWAPMGSERYDDIDTSWTFSPPGGQYGSGYRASQAPDGNGPAVDNLTFAGTVYTDQTRIVITNPNSFSAYLVNPVGYPNPGNPALSLWGARVTTTSATTGSGAETVADISDGGSARLYGAQLLELPASLWRQSSASMLTLARDLLSELSQPRPVLTDLQIVADPRLQLCDRVTIVDPDGLALEGTFHLAGIRTTHDASGLGQAITARATHVWSRPVAQYDVSTYDSNTTFYG